MLRQLLPWQLSSPSAAYDAGQVRPGGREQDRERGQGHGRGDGLDAELKHAEPDHDTTPRC